MVICGWSEICDVWTSFCAMPPDFNAAITAFIALALASLAARAVFASVVTPASISARSGEAETVASPLTEIEGGAGWASAGETSAMHATAAIRQRIVNSLLQGDKDVDDELVFFGLERIGDVVLDEAVLGFHFLVVEIVGDGLVGVVHVVVGAAMDELQHLAFRRLCDAHVLDEIL